MIKKRCTHIPASTEQTATSRKQGTKLTSPNSNWSFPEFTNPFCYFSSQLDLEQSVQMMVCVLPKQLERLANLPAAAKMYKYLGNFPTRVRSSNSTKCDTYLSQSSGNNTTSRGPSCWRTFTCYFPGLGLKTTCVQFLIVLFLLVLLYCTLSGQSDIVNNGSDTGFSAIISVV